MTGHARRLQRSSTGNRTPPGATAPSNPINFAVSGDGLSATLTWNSPSIDGGSPITGYRVARDGFDDTGAGPWTEDISASILTYTMNRLLANTTYTFTVAAINSVGVGPASTIAYTTSDSSVGTAQPTINAGQLNPNKTWALSFEDDFEGTSLDTTKWVVSDNTVRNELTTLASNVSVANSEVRLQLSSPDHGSEITTGYMWDPAAAKYSLPVGGFTEARVWFPGNGSGTVNTGYYNWPAWWTTGYPWPNAGEHDIAEILENHLTTNYHYGTHWDTDHQQINWNAPVGYWGNGWHIYGLYVGPTTATMYWDGVAVRTYVRQDTGTPHTLILNAGKSSTRYMPGYEGALRCDWVRAWEPVD